MFQRPRDQKLSDRQSCALSIIVVNYKSWPDVGTLAESLGKSPGFASGEAELVIVDNASMESPPAELRRGWAGVRLVLSEENGGFSAGVNIGWRVSSGRWLLLLNPDVVAGPELVDQVLERIQARESAGVQPSGITGFALQNPDGTPQASVGAEIGLLRTLIEPFFARARRKYLNVDRVQAGPVPWVTGACMLVDRQILDSVGGMDEDFFLYYEEVALCRSTRRLGRRVEFDPTIGVVHLRPLQNRPVSPAIRVVTRHSRLVFFQKHQPAWQFQSMVWLTRLEGTIRAAWAALRGRCEECRAWGQIRAIAKDMGSGTQIDGRMVRDIAFSASGFASAVTNSPHFESWVRTVAKDKDTEHDAARMPHG